MDQRAGKLEPHSRREIVDRDARGLTEHARQISRAHARRLRELREREFPPGILNQLILYSMDAGMKMRAVIEVDALLHVGSVAPQIHDHLARDVERDERTERVLDQRKRHVDSRCDARARRNRVVGDVEPIVEDSRGWIASSQFSDPAPMRRAAAAVEQAGLAKNERAGADRRDVRSLFGRATKPADDLALHMLGRRVRHARHDHQIAGADLGERFEIREDDALVRLNFIASRACANAKVLQSRGFMKRLQRSGQVENLDLRTDEEDYVPVHP